MPMEEDFLLVSEAGQATTMVRAGGGMNRQGWQRREQQGIIVRIERGRMIYT